MKSLPFFKSHYSLGKSILTLDPPTDKKGNPVERSVFNMALTAKLPILPLIEDGMTGYLEACELCKKNKLQLMYGLRLFITTDVTNQDEASLKNRARYVIFSMNNEGYQALIKIWTFAARDGFYYTPCIDFPNLKRLWSEHLTLAIPFYDSFLHLNALEGYHHVPVIDFTTPLVFLEDNQLPFDLYLRQKAQDYSAKNSYETLEGRSIYYKSKQDFIPYLTARCIAERTNIEKPEFNNMGSDSFNFERWMRENE